MCQMTPCDTVLLPGDLQQWPNGSKNVLNQRQGPTIYGCFGCEKWPFCDDHNAFMDKGDGPNDPWPYHLVDGGGQCQKDT